MGVSSVFFGFGVLFSGVGIALILFGLEKLAQSFGMKWSIFNSYGVVDHPDEFYENEKMTPLESKNNEIVLLKQEILMLKKLNRIDVITNSLKSKMLEQACVE